jgi:hypothetical protein
MSVARSLLTVRLDDPVRRRLASAARQRARTPSDLVRVAIEAWLDAEEGSSTGPSPYDAIADLVGSVRGDGSRGSTTKGRRAARELQGRRRAR